jgi:hypothetical protein
MGWRRFEILGAHDFIIDLGIGSIILAAVLVLRHKGRRICGLHAEASIAPLHFDDTGYRYLVSKTGGRNSP